MDHQWLRLTAQLVLKETIILHSFTSKDHHTIIMGIPILEAMQWDTKAILLVVMFLVSILGWLEVVITHTVQAMPVLNHLIIATTKPAASSFLQKKLVPLLVVMGVTSVVSSNTVELKFVL